jgi:hypothetical protein
MKWQCSLWHPPPEKLNSKFYFHGPLLPTLFPWKMRPRDREGRSQPIDRTSRTQAAPWETGPWYASFGPLGLRPCSKRPLPGMRGWNSSSHSAPPSFMCSGSCSCSSEWRDKKATELTSRYTRKWWDLKQFAPPLSASISSCENDLIPLKDPVKIKWNNNCKGLSTVTGTQEEFSE